MDGKDASPAPGGAEEHAARPDRVPGCGLRAARAKGGGAAHGGNNRARCGDTSPHHGDSNAPGCLVCRTGRQKDLQGHELILQLVRRRIVNLIRLHRTVCMRGEEPLRARSGIRIWCRQFPRTKAAHQPCNARQHVAHCTLQPTSRRARASPHAPRPLPLPEARCRFQQFYRKSGPGYLVNGTIAERHSTRAGHQLLRPPCLAWATQSHESPPAANPN